MKKYLLLMPVAALLAGCGGAGKAKKEDVTTTWYPVKTENKPFTRWWWLGSAVDKENLTRSLEAFSKAGMGGVEVANIYGVVGEESRDLQYLSPQWMEMYKHTVSEANRLGMYVDLTNGSGWPFGGPEVTPEDGATRLVTATYGVEGGKQLSEAVIAMEAVRRRGQGAQSEARPMANTPLSCLMAYSADGTQKLNLTDKVNPANGILDWTAPAGTNWTLYALFNGKTGQAVKRAAPGGEGLVLDHLNSDAFAKYLKKFDDAFAAAGAPAPRMFFNDSYEVYNADWTPAFLEEFAKRRGYKLEEYIPEFQGRGETEESRRVIADYRETLYEILMDDFIHPWIDWAHAKGSKVRNQSHGSPGNLVDIYATVDVPECETFGRTLFDIPEIRVDEGMKTNDSNPAVLKFASSAAHITGKTLTSAETFTWLTEHFRTSLSQCKPEIDQMFASGVNHVFFHGTPYSPADAEWPGWRFYASVNMSPTDPMWRDVDAFFTYITRAQSFLQHGGSDNDFLMYYPQYDVWNSKSLDNPYLAFSIHGLVDLLAEFNKAVMDVLKAGYDLDYISDKFIASLKFSGGKLVTEGGTSYEALIVPAAQLMPAETLEKLLALANQGATIIFSERYPSDVPGLHDLDKRRAEMAPVKDKLPAVASFDAVQSHDMGKGRVITGTVYSEILAATGLQPEAFRTEFGGQYTRRRYDGGHIYFMSMLHNLTLDGWVTISKPGKSVMIFDPMTGATGLAKTRVEGGKTQVYLQLKPAESVILKTFDDEISGVEDWKYLTAEGAPVTIERGWSLSFPESEPAIAGTFDIDTLGSWTDYGIANADINMGVGLYKVEFELPAVEAADWVLKLGQVCESARVRVNGKDAGKYWAIPFSGRVGSLLQPGKNTLEVEVTNLPANRIADYDRREVPWRKFKDINIVSISYRPITFDSYPVAPSGLLGDVTLTPMKSVF